MPDIQLNPVTRTRLYYILAFLLFDAAAAMYVAFSDPYGSASLYAFGFGFVMLACSGTVGSILLVEKFGNKIPTMGSSTRKRE